MILIVSSSTDLHALAVLKEIRSRGAHACELFAVDQIGQCEQIAIRISGDGRAGSLICGAGTTRFELAEVRVIWWRRPIGTPVDDRPGRYERFRHNQEQAALFAAGTALFGGICVSEPDATRRAENKIVQLETARRIGLRIPRTLISQSRDEVLKFHRDCGTPIIAKPLVANPAPLLFTQPLEDPLSYGEDAYTACPSIFQERIDGRRHLRLVSFGDQAFAAAIETDALDWRANLNVPVYEIDVPPEIRNQARRFLDALGLEMGVFDLKQNGDGDWVWLEINPQGQFLFLEPLLKLPLVERFSDYLMQLASRPPKQAPSPPSTAAARHVPAI
jgi:hypothetical protein